MNMNNTTVDEDFWHFGANRWSKKNYSYAEAMYLSSGLKNCENCTDCKNCDGCRYCWLCSDCRGCYGCLGCLDCVACLTCANISGARDAVGVERGEEEQQQPKRCYI